MGRHFERALQSQPDPGAAALDLSFCASAVGAGGVIGDASLGRQRRAVVWRHDEKVRGYNVWEAR